MILTTLLLLTQEKATSLKLLFEFFVAARAVSKVDTERTSTEQLIGIVSSLCETSVQKIDRHWQKAPAGVVDIETIQDVIHRIRGSAIFEPEQITAFAHAGRLLQKVQEIMRLPSKFHAGELYALMIKIATAAKQVEAAKSRN